MTGHPAEPTWNGKPTSELLRKIEVARETGRALYLVRRQMETAINALDAEVAVEVVKILAMPDVTDPRFIKLAVTYDCPDSPTGLCIFYTLHEDYCLFCDLPLERN